MTDIVKPGAGILFMKVGTHAAEDLDAIIARKAKEIEDTGFGMWGYGGNTCHPRTMVQPFAEQLTLHGQPITLCMESMTSNHFAEPLRAEEYSVDGANWLKMPPTIHVKGSRFALVIKDLRRTSFALPLQRTHVAVGLSEGRVGSRYVKGRVDKACLVVDETAERSNSEEVREIPISLTAELVAPYAVFVKAPG